MKRNALMPFALIAVVGIVLMIALSVVGQDKYKELVKENGGDEQSATPAKEDNAAKEDDATKEDNAAKEDDAAKEDESDGETSVDAKAAKATIKTNCIACHGENLEGGIGPSLKDVGNRLSDKEIKTMVEKGGNGMPPQNVKGEELDNLVAYLAEQKGK